jgi:single-strand DNA-binding protein
MSDVITLTGVVATPPNTVFTGAGLAITHFRLASNNRRFDRITQKWVDGESNFYSISAFRQTAHNVAASLLQGDRVVVMGRLRLKDWTSGDRTGMTAEIDADAIGHDLTWGTSHLTKVRRSGTYQEDSSTTNLPTTAELESAGEARDGDSDGGYANDELQSEGAPRVGDGDGAAGEDVEQHVVEVDVERASIRPVHAEAPF